MKILDRLKAFTSQTSILAAQSSRSPTEELLGYRATDVLLDHAELPPREIPTYATKALAVAGLQQSNPRRGAAGLRGEKNRRIIAYVQQGAKKLALHATKGWRVVAA